MYSQRRQESHPLLQMLTVGLVLVFAAVGYVQAQEGMGAKKHRIVFELASSGDEVWRSAIANVENAKRVFQLEGSEIELVAHNLGIGLVLQQDNSFAGQLEALSKSGVAILACEDTMEKKNVRRDDLLQFVKTVDSGVVEVVRKQEQGWSYIKAGM